MRKRIWTLMLALALLSTVLCGCGDGKGQDTPEARAAEGALNVGIAQDLDDSLDPHKTVKAGTREIMFNVFEGLVKPTTDGDLAPAIAERYEISPDGTTYTFTLREGVKFHNGEPVQMKDVLYSIRRCADDTEGEPLVPAFSAISDLSADGNVLTITLAEPNNEFLSYLTTAILPEGYDGQDTAPIGTGPFKFVIICHSLKKNIKFIITFYCAIGKSDIGGFKNISFIVWKCIAKNFKHILQDKVIIINAIPKIIK